MLGGGGVLGAAWMVGAMCAIEDTFDIDLRTCDYVVGTSAGSVMAALLASGVTPDEIRRHQLPPVINAFITSFLHTNL